MAALAAATTAAETLAMTPAGRLGPGILIASCQAPYARQMPKSAQKIFVQLGPPPYVRWSSPFSVRETRKKDKGAAPGGAWGGGRGGLTPPPLLLLLWLRT